MEQKNNAGSLNDNAGVLPMDNGAAFNGIHDEGVRNASSSINVAGKKGRGRQPKSAGSSKGSVATSDTPKRARGRPPKTSATPSPMKKTATQKKKKEESTTNGDANIKKRGRPSKTKISNEQTNGINKSKIQVAPITSPHEGENADEPSKKKRGRPSGTLSKKAVTITAPSTSSDASSAKRRSRPSGSTEIKKTPSKPKATVHTDGSTKKRGRPKKSAAIPAGSSKETPTVTSSNA